MKLLTKTTIYYLTMTLILFAIGGMVFYFSLREIMDENISENLEQTQEQVLSYVKRTSQLPPPPVVGSEILLFTPADAAVKQELKDTIFFNSFEEEELQYRELIFPVKTKEGWFTAVAGKPIVESDDLIETIANSLGIVAGILLAVLFLLNWLLSKSLWKPFYKTLDALKTFDLSRKEKLNLNASNTSEFKLLNEALEKMTEKIMRDYKNLKEFTENASHEIQTPLAIIRSKLELMIQSEDLPQEQVKFVQEVYESVNRLSKLNQSLLLLAKIENRQFDDIQNVNLKNLLENKLEQFEDLLKFKNITVENRLTPTPSPRGEGNVIKMNPHLADILLSNIVGNAIRHNVQDGKISIELKNDMLIVSNTGNTLDTSPEKLFERFQKASPSSESVGLGLSIVKQICEVYGFNASYTHARGIHTMTITF